MISYQYCTLDLEIVSWLSSNVFIFWFLCQQDLNRQVVKSDSASFTIPELEFESPAFSQKGGSNDIITFVNFFFHNCVISDLLVIV